MYYLHVRGGSRGNSSRGTNFGKLSAGNPKGWENKSYYGSLLAWNMFHAEGKNESEVKKLLTSLKDSGVFCRGRVVATTWPVTSHESAMKADDLSTARSVSWWLKTGETICDLPVVGKPQAENT